MNRMLLTLCTLLMAVSLQAMDERLERINAVKKSADYLYGEATMATQEDATSLAYELLQKEVFAWAQRDSVKLAVTTLADINRMADSIMTRRAEMYRVFVYVSKSDLLPKAKAPVNPKAKPVVTPKDSIAQHPADSVVQQPKNNLITDDVKRTIKQRFLGQKESDALYRLKKAKTFFELKPIMQPLKEKGEIIDYGKYATAKHPEECYLIIYDAAGNIKALLGKGKDIRTNLKTGRDDSIKNYRGCGAIWFTLKEN